MVKGEALSVLAGHFFSVSFTLSNKNIPLNSHNCQRKYCPNEKPLVSTKGFCFFMLF